MTDLSQRRPLLRADALAGLAGVFRPDGSNGWLITHHSLDGREKREKS